MEAACKEYEGEIESLILKNRSKDAREIKKSLLSKPEVSQEMALEKNLIRIRREMAENLSDLAQVIEKCLEAIRALKDPSLQGAYTAFYLLSKLIELPDQPLSLSWGHRALALSMLARQLNMTLLTIGDWEDGRTKWAIAVQNATCNDLRNHGENIFLESLKSPKANFPEHFSEAVRQELKNYEALPSPPFEGCNPDLVRLIS